MNIAIIVTPDFNMSATMAFVDPFRAANYLERTTHFRWQLYSLKGGLCRASNGLSITTESLPPSSTQPPDFALISSSWAPEKYSEPALLSVVRGWSRQGSRIGSLDTGAFIIAAAGLLDGKSATVHYEHIDALVELFPKVDVLEAMLVLDGSFFTCSGGNAAFDMGLHIIRESHGDALANASAKYIFHPQLRPVGSPQNASPQEPLGNLVPDPVRRAVQIMEQHLEDPLTIPQIVREVGISQRQLNRLFARDVGKTAKIYYRDIRLDRARSLVTQTNLTLSQISVASGFGSQVHFSRAYKQRFGLAPSIDRVEGRVPFEYRAWPMFRQKYPNLMSN